MTIADQFADAYRVTRFASHEAAYGRIQSPADFIATVNARKLAGSSGLPSHGSALEVAYVAAGAAGDRQLVMDLEAAWDWWNGNVRGRIWEPPAAAFGLFTPAPMDYAPYPQPEPAAHQWIPAVQQQQWWAAARRQGGKRARTQAGRWAEIRDLAHPVYREQIRRVLDVIDRTAAAFELPASDTNRRAALWV